MAWWTQASQGQPFLPSIKITLPFLYPPVDRRSLGVTLGLLELSIPAGTQYMLNKCLLNKWNIYSDGLSDPI